MFWAGTKLFPVVGPALPPHLVFEAEEADPAVEHMLHHPLVPDDVPLGGCLGAMELGGGFFSCGCSATHAVARGIMGVRGFGRHTRQGEFN
jgi:hypothetical protein